jgi:hypothetical protein
MAEDNGIEVPNRSRGFEPGVEGGCASRSVMPKRTANGFEISWELIQIQLCCDVPKQVHMDGKAKVLPNFSSHQPTQPTSLHWLAPTAREEGGAVRGSQDRPKAIAVELEQADRPLGQRVLEVSAVLDLGAGDDDHHGVRTVFRLHKVPIDIEGRQICQPHGRHQQQLDGNGMGCEPGTRRGPFGARGLAHEYLR